MMPDPKAPAETALTHLFANFSFSQNVHCWCKVVGFFKMSGLVRLKIFLVALPITAQIKTCFIYALTELWKYMY